VCVALVPVAIVTRCALIVAHIDRLDPETFTLARLEGLVAGAFVASLLREPPGLGPYRTRIRSVAAGGVLAVFATIVAQHSASPSGVVMHSIGLSVVGLTAAAVVADLMANPRSLMARWLSLAPLRWVGTISYGLYVIHAPVALLLGPRISSSMLAPAVLLTSTALAAASWYWFESPILSFKRRCPMPDARREVPDASPRAAPSLSLPVDT
jgi:peptidoglycan/LPS O-acetylase OafA/YrhL